MKETDARGSDDDARAHDGVACGTPRDTLLRKRQALRWTAFAFSPSCRPPVGLLAHCSFRAPPLRQTRKKQGLTNNAAAAHAAASWRRAGEAHDCAPETPARRAPARVPWAWSGGKDTTPARFRLESSNSSAASCTLLWVCDAAVELSANSGGKAWGYMTSLGRVMKSPDSHQLHTGSPRWLPRSMDGSTSRATPQKAGTTILVVVQRDVGESGHRHLRQRRQSCGGGGREAAARRATVGGSPRQATP